MVLWDTPPPITYHLGDLGQVSPLWASASASANGLLPTGTFSPMNAPLLAKEPGGGPQLRSSGASKAPAPAECVFQSAGGTGQKEKDDNCQTAKATRSKLKTLKIKKKTM